jgi:DNA polymerase elongation subunit (family B)
MNDWSKRLIVAGISCLDYMELFKKFAEKKEPSYALGNIGKKFVNIEKISYKGDLNELYRADLNKYLEYNLNDVKIVVALENKLQYIGLAQKICHIGHVSYESFIWSSRYIEGAILTYLRRNGNLVAPSKSLTGAEEYEQQIADDEEGFEGAYVKDPIPGRYDWIYDLDLTSMYPNIIISLNISPETKLGKVDVWDSRKFADKLCETISVAGSKYTVDEFDKFIHENNICVASNGVMYKLPDATQKLGVIPTILVNWFNERKDMRKKAKAAADAKDWHQYEFYDQRQKVQKILLNSVYGVLGLPIFRFYDKDNAEAVTTTGVTIIKTAGDSINRYYHSILNDDADHVIYQDTDSCFCGALPLIRFKYPGIDENNVEAMTKAILDVCTDVQLYVNKSFDVMAKTLFNIDSHRFDAKQEVIAKTGFWLVKKRYTQLIINKGGVTVDEMEVKGIDVVRTSFPIRFRSFMTEFLLDILNKVDKTIIDEKILAFRENIFKLSTVEVAKNTSVKFVSPRTGANYNPKTRRPFQFVTKSPAQVKAALGYNDLLILWGLDKKFQPIMTGQKIKWVYVKQNQYDISELAFKADDTDPDELLQFINDNVDREMIYERELKGKLKYFYDVLRWTFPDVNSKNADLFFDFD